jgi:hypothetical protein
LLELLAIRRQAYQAGGLEYSVHPLASLACHNLAISLAQGSSIALLPIGTPALGGKPVHGGQLTIRAHQMQIAAQLIMRDALV